MVDFGQVARPGDEDNPCESRRIRRGLFPLARQPLTQLARGEPARAETSVGGGIAAGSKHDGKFIQAEPLALAWVMRKAK